MNDRLRADLDAGATTFAIPPGDVDAVKSRGNHRSERTRRLAGASAVVALLAGTVGVLQLGDDGPDEARLATEGGAPAQLGDSGIVWERVDDPATALGGFQSEAPVAVGDRLYALSTAPGERADDQPSPRVLWSSDDGVEWTQASGPDDLYVMDLAASGDRLYAVGTGPASIATGRDSKVHELLVGTSDGAGGWDAATLPLDVEAIAAQSTSVYVGGTEVAAGPEGVVAAVSVHAELDVRALLPDGVEAANGWALERDGVAVLGDGPTCPTGTSPTPPDVAHAKRGDDVEPTHADPSGRVHGVSCWDGDGNDHYVPTSEAFEVAGRYSWADLGVADVTRRAVLSEPFVFHAGDAGFEPVTLPSVAGGGGELMAHPDGGFVYARSVPRQHPTDVAHTMDFVLLRSADGRTWQRDETGVSDIDGISSLGTVDGRLALVGHSRDGSVYAQLGDAGWKVTPIGDLVGVPTTEQSGAWVTAASIGPLGAVIGVAASEPDGDIVHSLLTSRDGSTWSMQPLAELAGDGVRGISQITVEADRAAVSVAVSDGDPEQPSRIVAVVGTPR